MQTCSSRWERCWQVELGISFWHWPEFSNTLLTDAHFPPQKVLQFVQGQFVEHQESTIGGLIVGELIIFWIKSWLALQRNLQLHFWLKPWSWTTRWSNSKSGIRLDKKISFQLPFFLLHYDANQLLVVCNLNSSFFTISLVSADVLPWCTGSDRSVRHHSKHLLRESQTVGERTEASRDAEHNHSSGRKQSRSSQ